jgi:ubiquinone biosynthesis protein UbiJ
VTASPALAAALEKALDLLLRQDPQALQRCAAMEGRVVALQISGFGLTLYFAPGPEGIQVLSYYEGEPDTRLRGTPLALARMSLGGRENALFKGDVEIRGDTEVGQQLQDILAATEWDWEEQLSRVTGDIVAHQTGELVRRAGRSIADGRETLRQDLTEYLQEESRLLPSRGEVEHFLSEVDQLRADADRLSARVQRLLRAASTES